MTEIEQLIANQNWEQARALLHHELLAAPTDHWLWYSLSLAYYEDQHYDLALTCSKRAVELQPDCPLALWHYAGSLSMTGRESAAFAIWTVLLDMDAARVANDECGEGMDAALRLLNDNQYRLGRFHQHRGNIELARSSFEKYLHNRKHGVESTYDQTTVEAILNDLRSNEPSPPADRKLGKKRAALSSKPVTPTPAM